ncbi:MAG: glycoside hydrolase family 99-like domain-containing protein [Candidatus Gracilibacteria bacterium]
MRKTNALLLGIVGIASFIGFGIISNGTMFRSDVISQPNIEANLPLKIGAYYSPIYESTEPQIGSIVNAYPGRLPIISKEDVTSTVYLKKEIETAKNAGIDFFIVQSTNMAAAEEKQFFNKLSENLQPNFSYALAVEASNLTNSETVEEIKKNLNISGYLKNKTLKPVVFVKNIHALTQTLDNKDLIAGGSLPNTKDFFSTLKATINADLIAVDDLSPTITGTFPFDEETYREVFPDIKNAIRNGALSNAYSHYQIDLSRPIGQQELRPNTIPYQEYFYQKRLPIIISETLASLGFETIAGYSGISVMEKTEPLAFYSNYRKVMEKFMNLINTQQRNIIYIPSLLAGWDPHPVADMSKIPAVITGQSPEEFEELGTMFITAMHLANKTPEFLLINSWNDYAHMEPIIPTRQWNTQFLAAITQLRSKIAEEFSIQIPRPKRVLFLGNSLTFHPPLADANWDGLSWDGNWGMAASTEDKDYVHQVQKIVSEGGHPIIPLIPGKDLPSGGGVIYGYLNILQQDAIKKVRPDVIVIQLAENRESPADASKELEAYEKNYRALLTFLSAEIKVPILMVGSWAESTLAQGPRNQIMTPLASEFGADFIDITSVVNNPLSHPSSNEHNWMPGVLWHPGDVGMRGIAEKISEKLLPHLQK